MERGVGGPEQQYSLRWNDYHVSILSSFRHLRDEEDFVDVTLACDGRSFTAHKVVLSACSPYFRKLLKANPCQHPIVILRDVKQRDMESLLRFMYNGEVHIGQEQLADFLKTAQTLQVRGLADVPAKEQHRLSTGSEHLGWGQTLDTSGRDEATPPPAKRSRADRYSDSPALNSELHRDSLLGQALEGGHQAHFNPQVSMSTGDDSSTNDSASDKLEGNNNGRSSGSHRHGNGERDHHRSSERGSERDAVPKSEPSDYGEDLAEGMDPGSARNPYSAAILGLQGLTGLLPGPSGIHNSNQENFVNRRGLDMMRVRATDPRPCPKCGKIYRSAHTLRTHLEDKHTVCPGYRCVLCGTVAKSRNSLHSHMSRQHRGISTKDLPVVPMPAPFDPELASRLLAKAGVRVSAAELAARASPTGPRRSDLRLDLKNANNDRGGGGYGDNPRHHSSSAAPSEGGGSSVCGEDPEDLSVPSRFDVLSPPGGVNNQQQSVITKNKVAALMAAAAAAQGGSSKASLEALAQNLGAMEAASSSAGTGSALLDTYLQMIAETHGGLAALSMVDQQAALLAAKAAAAQAMARSAPHGSAENDKRGSERGHVSSRHHHHHSSRAEEPRGPPPPAPPHVPQGAPQRGGGHHSSEEEYSDDEDEEEEATK